MKNRRSGFAIVYGLIILLFATLTGTAILALTRYDRESAAHYQNSQAASQAAQAALKAIQGQLANAPDTTVALLRKFLTNSSYKWFFGHMVSDATSPQMINLTNNLGTGSKYCAKILGFDSVSSLLTVEATGYDDLGSKKKIAATFQLGGLSSLSLKSLRSYGLFLGGSLENCNSVLNIKGDVYLSMGGATNPQHFNSGGTITGDLKTGNSNNVFDVSSNLTVTGKAYMRCPMTCNNAFRVNGKSGFEKPITTLNSQMQLFDSSFFDFSPYSAWNSSVNLNNHAVIYNPCIPVAKFVNKTTGTSSASIDVAAHLGMTGTDEAIDTVKLPADLTPCTKFVSIPVGDSITAANVESWWTAQQAAGLLYQGEWLVVRLQSDIKMAAWGTVTRKVIWITDSHCMNVGGNWYDCSASANTFVYINGSGFTNDMGVPANKSFRGFIYVSTTYANNVIFKFGTGSTLNGAIECAKGKFDLNAGNFTLDFSAGSTGQDAVQEIVDLGLVVAAN